jgi:hypothetical protein
MLDTDRVSVLQNGVVMTRRQEALDRVRGNPRGIAAIRDHWKRQDAGSCRLRRQRRGVSRFKI